jgi:hypothetical protein
VGCALKIILEPALLSLLIDALPNLVSLGGAPSSDVARCLILTAALSHITELCLLYLYFLKQWSIYLRRKWGFIAGSIIRALFFRMA